MASPEKLKRIIETNFELVKDRSTAEELVIICPEPGCPDRSGNRSINVKTGKTNCWRCNSGGSVKNFLARHGFPLSDFETAEDVDTVMRTVNVGLEDGDAVADYESSKQVVKLPKGFTPITESNLSSAKCRHIAKMAVRKHLYVDDFMDAGAGFTQEGPWSDFCIFPVVEMGRIVYYQGRTFSIARERGSTKKFPSKLEIKYGASYWLYGFDEIVASRPSVVIVVESILNVLSLRHELSVRGIAEVGAIAVFKHKISKAQKKKILALPCKEICMMYDGDATTDAWEEARNMSSKRQASVAEMPIGIDANDDAKLAVDNFLNRKTYNPADHVMSELLS